jgi:two-component system chemotaxis response regulator CheB
MIMKPGGTLEYVAGDPALIHRPSVDVFFESLALVRSRTGAAVLLTGMGQDGASGLLCLRQLGWRTFAQDEATSVVWGMPGEVVRAGLADAVLPLGQNGVDVAMRLKRRGG